jgi:hypothetical protein
MKKIFIQILIVIVGFLIIDFLFGNLFFINHFKSIVYEKNDQFLYNFKKNLDIKNYNYGSKNYKLCTNNLGAIDDCKKENIITKNIDYVFIGDSFVEGLGVQFDKTFFGLLKNKYPKFQFLNLGVSGYSSSIYYNKLKFFYDNGYNFSEIYIFLDTSDIFDEIYRYKSDSNDQISHYLTNNQINNLLDDKKKLLKDIYNKFPGTFFLIGLLINALPNLSFLENYYYDLMINHSFSGWQYEQNKIFSKDNVTNSLKKNSNYVKKIIKLANENNSKINFVLYPWPGHLHKMKVNNKYNKFWTNFLENKDINLINLNSHFFKLLEKNDSKKIIFKYYIKGDVHFNIQGHKYIFEIINNNLKTIIK